jgi:hypothetical protein
MAMYIWRKLRTILQFYITLSFIYGFWVFVFLNTREPIEYKYTAMLARLFIIFTIAVVRGILWGPNLIDSLAKGRFIDDWLLLRDVAPIDQLMGIFG